MLHLPIGHLTPAVSTRPLDSAGLHDWSQELGCTEAELIKDIAEVGEHVAAVREHLAGRR